MGMDALVRKVLRDVGINDERVCLDWASAAEATHFVKLITEFTEKMKNLGPLGEAEGIDPDDLQTRLAKALDAISSRKVRISYGNATKAVRKDAIWTQDHIDKIIETKTAKSIAGFLE